MVRRAADKITGPWARFFFLSTIEDIAPRVLADLADAPLKRCLAVSDTDISNIEDDREFQEAFQNWQKTYGLTQEWAKDVALTTLKWWWEKAPFNPPDSFKHWYYAGLFPDGMSAYYPNWLTQFTFKWESDKPVQPRYSDDDLKREIRRGFEKALEKYIKNVSAWRKVLDEIPRGVGPMPDLPEDKKQHFRWVVYAYVLNMTTREIRNQYARHVGTNQAIDLRIGELAEQIGLPKRKGSHKRNNLKEI